MNISTPTQTYLLYARIDELGSHLACILKCLGRSLGRGIDPSDLNIRGQKIVAYPIQSVGYTRPTQQTYITIQSPCPELDCPLTTYQYLHLFTCQWKHTCIIKEYMFLVQRREARTSLGNIECRHG